MIDAPLILLPHNWDENVKRKLSWKTDILVAQNGTEQRRRLRTEPIEELSYHITLLNAEEEGELQNILWSAQDMRVAVPRWEDAMLVKDPIVALDTLISLTQDATYRQMVGDAVIWIEGVGYEEIVVASVASNALTLTGSAAYDWPSGAMVIPVVIGRLISPVPGDTYGQLKGNVNITVQVESNISEFAGGGDSFVAVPASIAAYGEAISEGVISQGDVQAIVAEVFDANGNLIPDADVTASTTDPNILVYPNGMPNVFNVKNMHTGGLGIAFSVDIDITAGALTTTVSVSIV